MGSRKALRPVEILLRAQQYKIVESDKSPPKLQVYKGNTSCDCFNRHKFVRFIELVWQMKSYCQSGRIKASS